MCSNCNCTCNECYKQKVNEIFQKQNENERYKKIDQEIIAHNFPIILDLVRKYNEITLKEPERYSEAEEKQRLMNEIAYKIVKYCR